MSYTFHFSTGGYSVDYDVNLGNRDERGRFDDVVAGNCRVRTRNRLDRAWALCRRCRPEKIELDARVNTPIESPFRSRQQREADREAKREAVLVAAVRMFNERGFFSTTFDDVAASLGISKPTIYHYLGNKEEVLLECYGRGISELKQAAASVDGSPGTGLDRLRTYLVRYVQVNMGDFGRCVIRTAEDGLSAEATARLRTLKREIDSFMRELIGHAMEDGSIAPGNVKLIAFTIAGALAWPARWYKPELDDDRQVLAESMVDLLICGFKTGGTTDAAKPSVSRKKAVR